MNRKKAKDRFLCDYRPRRILYDTKEERIWMCKQKKNKLKKNTKTIDGIK